MPSSHARGEVDALLAEQRWEDARRLLRLICGHTRTDVDARIKLSIAERQCGDLDLAEKHARAAVRRAPKLFMAHQVLALALHARGELVKAVRSYRESVALQSGFPDTHYLLGTALQELGRLGEATAAFERALSLRPYYIEALVGLGAVWLLQGNSEGAEQLFHAALSREPNSVEALANLATIREQAGAADESLALYRRALDQAPDRLDLRAMAAASCERFGRLSDARELLLGIDPAGMPTAALVAARLAQRAGNPAEGLAIIDRGMLGLIDPILSGEMHKLAGQLLDTLGRPDEAFRRVYQGNLLIAEALSVDLAGAPPYLTEIHQAAATAATGEWMALPAARPHSFTPAFLIGFPRSGTTLLEQMLDGHPDLTSIDEKPIAEVVADQFAAMCRDESATLASLTIDQRDRLRACYFSEGSRYLPPEYHGTALDKLPLNIVHVPLLARIMPEARFILAVRHPLDVVLSCFMQSFAYNTATRSFLSMRHVALTYQAVMRNWREEGEKAALNLRSVRYEDVVAEPRLTLQPILEFLDLSWDAAVLDHVATARAKAVINTPSYHQVALPLYDNSLAKWHHFRSHVSQAAAILKEEIEILGYEPFSQ